MTGFGPGERRRLTRTQRQIEEHRQATAVIEVRDPRGRPCPGIRVSFEQESHEFPFACVVPDLSDLSPHDRDRYDQRLHEVFNQVRPVSQRNTPDPAVLSLDATRRTHLGTLRSRLDRLAARGKSLEVAVSGQTVGMAGPTSAAVPSLSQRDAAKRVAELYALCFSHRAVCGIVWHGLWDGEPGVSDGGLLRLDLAPKHAHKVLRKLLGTIWHTRQGGETDAQGRFSFRGFYGTYRVVVTGGESPAPITTMSLNRKASESSPLIVEIPGNPA